MAQHPPTSIFVEVACCDSFSCLKVDRMTFHVFSQREKEKPQSKPLTRPLAQDTMSLRPQVGRGARWVQKCSLVRRRCSQIAYAALNLAVPAGKAAPLCSSRMSTPTQRKSFWVESPAPSCLCAEPLMLLDSAGIRAAAQKRLCACLGSSPVWASRDLHVPFRVWSVTSRVSVLVCAS